MGKGTAGLVCVVLALSSASCASDAPKTEFVLDIEMSQLPTGVVSLKVGGGSGPVAVDHTASVALSFSSYEQGVAAGPQDVVLVDGSGATLTAGALMVWNCQHCAGCPNFPIIELEEDLIPYSTQITQASASCYLCEGDGMKAGSCP